MKKLFIFLFALLLMVNNVKSASITGSTRPSSNTKKEIPIAGSGSAAQPSAQPSAETTTASETDGSESGEEGDQIDPEVMKAGKECAALLLGDTDGNIFVQDNIKDKWPLASVTKMMTLFVTYDEIKKGKISLNDKVVIPKLAVNVGGSKIPMKEGDEFTLEDLMKASGIHSANNATYAIANYVGGSIDKFVVMMNKKAAELGLSKELEYHTPAGLPSHMTKKKMDIGTAYGIYQLSRRFSKINKLMSIASTQSTSIHNGKIKIKNRNHLLGKDGIYGIKTGYHTKSGYNISIVAEKDGLKTITVVFGGHSYKERDSLVVNTVEQFYSNYAYKNIINTDTSLVKIPVLRGEEKYIELYPDKDFTKMVTAKDTINIKIKRIAKVIAPVKANEVLGTYSITVNNKEVMSGELKSKEAVKLNIN